jgi:PAS domain S-box-containing protein
MGPTNDELERAIALFPEAMLVCDPEGRIVSANQQVCALTGYALEDLLTKTLDELADPVEAKSTVRLLPRLQGDARLDLETTVRCKDGSTSRLHLSARALPMGARPHSVVRLARRRRAADRLTQDPEFIRALLQTPGTLLLSVCADGELCYASPAFQALTGLDFRGIRGRRVWDLLPDADERDLLRDALSSREANRTLELTWPSAQGEPRKSLWTPTRLGGLPPEPPYILLVGQEVPPPRRATRRSAADADSQQEMERRIGELTAQLEEARSEHEALTYTIAHDLRAPLRAMTGFSDTLLQDYADQPLDETGKNYAQRIAESAHRMDALIEDLLVYNRLGRSPVSLGPIFLEEATAEALGLFAREIRDRGAAVELDVPPVEVVADRPMLFLVLTHLVSNAIKFSEPGSPPRIKIRGERREDWVRLEIEDNGIGISPEYLDRIFGVFQRLNKAEAYAGTGMGLAITKRAMERMAGRIGVESAPGKGSRFWIELRSPYSQ